MTCARKFSLLVLSAATSVALLLPVRTNAQTGVDMGCSPTVLNPCTATPSSGTTTLSPAMRDAASLLGNALGGALHKALFGDPAEDARRAALLRQQRAMMAENARRRVIEDNRRREEMFQRMMGRLKLSAAAALELKNFDGDRGALILKGVDVSDSPGGNALHLKLGDSTDKGDNLRPAGTLAFEEHRATTPPVSPQPNSDPMVVDLRDVQQSAFLVQSAATVSPDDAPVLLDEALSAANGDKSFIARVPAGFVLPAIDAPGLLAFQTANAEYRRANDSRMHLIQVFSDAQQRREQADRLAEAAVADLQESETKLADETILKRKHELMSAIFADVRARDEAFAKAMADAESARTRKYYAGQEAIRVLRAVTTGQPPATFHPPIPSLVEIDESTWAQVQQKVDNGWKELEREGDNIRRALAGLKLKVPLTFVRMREGVVLGARTDNTDAVAMDDVSSPFTTKTYREMNEIADKARKAGIDELGGAMVVSFGTTKTGTLQQQAVETVRFLGDHFTDGLVSLHTPEGREAIEKLSGKAFDRLIAHSNGSPIAESLIEAGLIKVNELNIVGGDRSLLNGHRLQKLLDDGKVKRVVVWINLNDPVVWASAIDQLKPAERGANALEHIMRKITGDLAGGDSRVQFRPMYGQATGDDLFKQHRIDTAYYSNIRKYFRGQ